MNAARSDKDYVKFAGVRKTFDGKTLVVKDLNLDVARGEFLTLLGPSGSGKTTCLLMLAGFETLSEGDILLDGRSVGYIPPQKRNIGVVFQSYALFPHMTIAENIAFPLEARGMNKADRAERVARALDMVRLGAFAERLPGQMSGGQQQRVALARAVVFEPTLVLMDEPLGALDKQLREEMQYEIVRLQQRLGVTVVYVTHDQTEALTMSNRIAVFDQGVIQQLASPRDLYERPQNAFVARFIGENNRLGGTVSRIAGAECAVETNTGATVLARPVNVAGPNAPTTLSIRPERVLVGDGADRAANRFEATVDEVIFHGDHLRVSTTVCGQPGFIVKIPNGSEARIPERGRPIRIGWAVDDCHALDRHPGGTA